MKGVTTQSCQVNKVGGEEERNMHSVSGKFRSSFHIYREESSSDKLGSATRKMIARLVFEILKV